MNWTKSAIVRRMDVANFMSAAFVGRIEDDDAARDGLRMLRVPTGVAHGCKAIHGPVHLFYITTKIYKTLSGDFFFLRQNEGGNGRRPGTLNAVGSSLRINL